jgi:hypothetical protein
MVCETMYSRSKGVKEKANLWSMYLYLTAFVILVAPSYTVFMSTIKSFSGAKYIPIFSNVSIFKSMRLPVAG